MKRGGDNPRFHTDNVCALPYSAQRGARMKLQCEVWDCRPGADDELLSMGRVDVTEVVGRKRSDVFMAVPLRGMEHGDLRGRLTISLRSRYVRQL